jgi:hypothetical protein
MYMYMYIDSRPLYEFQRVLLTYLREKFSTLLKAKTKRLDHIVFKVLATPIRTKTGLLESRLQTDPKETLGSETFQTNLRQKQCIDIACMTAKIKLHNRVSTRAQDRQGQDCAPKGLITIRI